jgi:hypothetical protein
VSKGDKPARVPLPLPALPAVEAAIDGRTSGPLLRTHTGAGMDRRSVHRYVARTAGISRPIGPHALRRTVGLNQGVPLADIQPLLRHARPETTLASSDISPDAPERHASHQVAGLPSVRRLTSTMAPTLPSPSASEPSDGAEPSGRARDTTRGPRDAGLPRVPAAAHGDVESACGTSPTGSVECSPRAATCQYRSTSSRRGAGTRWTRFTWSKPLTW